MATFMGTFGVRYYREEHPSGHPVDPDGYVLIEAEDYDKAVALMQAKYGINYAFIRPEKEFGESNIVGKTGYDYHPLGMIDSLGFEE